MSYAVNFDRELGGAGDFMRYAPALRAYFTKRGHGYEADDLVQDCMVRMQARKATAPVDNAEGFLFQVAFSVLLDRIRSDRVRRRSMHCQLEETLHPVEELSPERVLEGRERVRLVQAVLSEMPERTRKAFVLVRLDGKSYSLAAREMGVSVSAIEKHIMKAVRLLTERLRGDDENGSSAIR